MSSASAPPPGTTPFARALREEQVRQHQDAGATSAAASALLALGLPLFIGPVQHTLRVAGALALLLLMLGLRLAWAGRGGAETEARLRRFRLVALLHGIAWGVYAAVLLNDGQVAGAEVVGYGAAAVAAGSLAISSS